MKNYIIILSLSLISCGGQKSIKGNYYNKCYSCHFPMLILTIEDKGYSYFSPCVIGEKSIGEWSYDNGVLFLIEKKSITRNFSDTLIVNDTLKYFVKGKKLTPFNTKTKECYFIKTKDKNKLIKLP